MFTFADLEILEESPTDFYSLNHIIEAQLRNFAYQDSVYFVREN